MVPAAKRWERGPGTDAHNKGPFTGQAGEESRQRKTPAQTPTADWQSWPHPRSVCLQARMTDCPSFWRSRRGVEAEPGGKYGVGLGSGAWVAAVSSHIALGLQHGLFPTCLDYPLTQHPGILPSGPCWRFPGSGRRSALRHVRLLAIIKVQLGLQTPREFRGPPGNANRA